MSTTNSSKCQSGSLSHRTAVFHIRRAESSLTFFTYFAFILHLFTSLDIPWCEYPPVKQSLLNNRTSPLSLHFPYAFQKCHLLLCKDNYSIKIYFKTIIWTSIFSILSITLLIVYWRLPLIISCLCSTFFLKELIVRLFSLILLYRSFSLRVFIFFFFLYIYKPLWHLSAFSLYFYF